VVSSNGFVVLNKISYKMVTRITEMERMTTISLIDHFMMDMITHRFSLTTLDNDIADHRTFSYQQKNVYGKIRDFEKKK
jgi:hypothetical protein